MAKSKKRPAQEIQVQKSPAEFFAENQAIAGFDNMGKSLYTTIRELVENSLDACESVEVLPDIVLKIEEMDQIEFNKIRGVKETNDGNDEGLFQKKGKSNSNSSNVNNGPSSSKKTSKSEAGGSNAKGGSASATKKKNGRAEEAYFRISVRDNGCGMTHDAIPDLLGRVLSGSKYGVRQTRGKFGLGAKMALIWSKKSTGVPIKIQTSHIESQDTVSICVLDIDIYKNAPKVIEHRRMKNNDGWKGTKFEVLIAGNWSTYKSRLLQYFQQLAIITPYAKLEMQYSKSNDTKKDMTIRYDRRSEQMPSPAREVKHHPSSVNNLLIQQLLDRSKSKTLMKFLCDDLSGVSPSIAKRVVAELGNGFKDSMKPSELDGKQITRLVQLLRSVELFKAPDGSCLSPLGEYNLNLGIRKTIEPDIVATARDKPCAYEGHSFIVEAAISLGGKNSKEGINVIRFANRIPLLFEAGADVCTRVAQNKIKWSSYKIDHKKDKICVFVSIVSTKIPFKGTGKEYIGDDITEIQTSVKRALQSCCQQLRSQLTKRNALRDAIQRKSRLVKYVPDASRAIMGILDVMRKRKLEELEDEGNEEDEEQTFSPRKLTRTIGAAEKLERDSTKIIADLDDKKITEDVIKNCLYAAIEAHTASTDGTELSSGADTKKNGCDVEAQPVFLLPLQSLDDADSDIHHSLFTFRPMKSLSLLKLE